MRSHYTHNCFFSLPTSGNLWHLSCDYIFSFYYKLFLPLSSFLQPLPSSLKNLTDISTRTISILAIPGFLQLLNIFFFLSQLSNLVQRLAFSTTSTPLLSSPSFTTVFDPSLIAMALVRSLTKIQNKISRTTSMKRRSKSPTSEAPSPKSTTSKFSFRSGKSSPATETEPKDYFMSIAFEQTAEPTASPLLGDSFAFNPVSLPTPPVLSRAASILSRRSSTSSKRSLRHNMSRHNSESSARTPSLGYSSPAASTTSFPRTPIENDYFNIPVMTPMSGTSLSEGFEKHHHKGAPSHSSSYYSPSVLSSDSFSNASTLSGSATTTVKKLNVLREEPSTDNKCDEIAMQILEKVSAEEYSTDLDTFTI